MQNDAREATFRNYISQTEEKLAEVQQLLSNQSHLIDQVSSQVEAAEKAALQTTGRAGGTEQTKRRLLSDRFARSCP